MEWGALRRVVGQELSTHHHLTVANLAQRSGVLWDNTNRGGPFLREAGVVEDQDAISHWMQFQQPLYAGFI